MLGLIGVLLAITMAAQSAAMQMLRSQLIRWLIYIAVMGFLMSGIDNYAHFGGLISGFVLGKIMVDRAADVSPEEGTRANLLGWATALVIAASLGMVAFGVLTPARYERDQALKCATHFSAPSWKAVALTAGVQSPRHHDAVMHARNAHERRHQIRANLRRHVPTAWLSRIASTSTRNTSKISKNVVALP